MKFATLSRSARFALTAVVAVVVGGMVTLGFSAPAFATGGTDVVTIKVVNKAGTAQSAVTVYPIQVQDGVVAQPGGADLSAATPVGGKPGYFTASLTDGDTYTLEIDPTGSAANNGTWQLLGGGEDIDQAQTFTPSGPTFITATFDNEGTITGKVTSSTGAALKNAEADVYYYDAGQWQLGSWSLTGSTGVYSLTNLQPGSYKLKFWSPTGNYPPVYSGGASTLETASPVVVGPGKTVTVNAKFTAYTASISGTAIVYYDGNPYYDINTTATAYPVLATDGSGHATSVDFGHPVASGHANSHGQWTISNVKPDTYVVLIEPYYYNEEQQWVGASDPSQGLSSATVFTVASGQKVAAGETDLTGNSDGDGANPSFTTFGPDGTTGVDAFVTVTNASDGLEYLSGESKDGQPAQMFWGDGTAFDSTPYSLQPGTYTITAIDPNGGHEVFKETEYIPAEDSTWNLDLPTVTTQPGFSSPGSIAETDLTVGTTYTVAGQASARLDGTISYQWLRDGKPIYSAACQSNTIPCPDTNATSASYQSTGADFGHHISVRLTVSSFGFNPVTEIIDGPTGTETAGPAPTNDGAAPSIVGPSTVYVGNVLQANVGGWDATGLQFQYYWRVGASTIGNGPSLVVPASAMNQSISLIVQATKAGYTSSDLVNAVSPVSVLAHLAPTNTKAPSVSKTSIHGVTTYTGNAGSWNTTGLTYTYKWTEGAPSTGTQLSASNKYVASGTGILADPVEYTVTASKAGYAPGTKTIIVNKGTTPFSETTGPVVEDITTSTPLPDNDDPSVVGHTLAVVTPANWDANGNPPTGWAYQWYRNAFGKSPVAISGATHSSYVVSSADVGNFLTVRETASSSTYTSASVVATAGSGVVSGALVATPATVSIHGVAAQGQVLSAAVTAWPTTGVTNSYQWLDCPTPCTDDNVQDWTAISGATHSTLTVLSAYANIAVRVTGSKAGYTPEQIWSDAASTSAATEIVTLSNPTISGLVGGHAHVGVKLTAVSGKFTVSSLTAHYVWSIRNCDSGCTDTQASGPGSNTSTYTPTAADLATGDQIFVTEMVTRTGYSQKDLFGDDSAAVELDAGTVKVVKAPTLTTTTSLFTINASSYSPAGGTTTIDWYADGTSAGTGSTYTRNAAADTGKSIWATVTYSIDGYTPYTATIIAQKGTLAPGDAESVTGAAYGDTLGISSPTPFTDVASKPITLSYQWYSNGAAIKGATGKTFKPSTSYINHHIQVKITGSSSYYNSSSVTTSSSFLFVTGSLGTLTLPTVTYTGTLMPGTVMTGNAPTGYVPTGVTIARQWQRWNGTTFVSISKATGTTYTPAATDVGAQFRVQVTSSKSGYGTVTLWSAPVTVNYSTALATLTPPVVTGTPTVGSVLTANPGVWNATSLTYAYQWYRDGVPIPGATASTYTPDFTDGTDTLSFWVTASRTGYQPVTVKSGDQLIGLGTITATSQPKISVSGSTYTVSTGSWSVDGLVFSYQWQVGGSNATGTGATTDSYTRLPTDAGPLTVNITVSRPGYNDLPLTINGPNLVALV